MREPHIDAPGAQAYRLMRRLCAAEQAARRAMENAFDASVVPRPHYLLSDVQALMLEVMATLDDAKKEARNFERMVKFRPN